MRRRSISRCGVASYSAACRFAVATLITTSPSGKLSTSVGRSLRRNSRFSLRIAASPTSVIETVASGCPTASSNRWAVRRNVVSLRSRLRTRLTSATGISANDRRHERMPNDVGVVELDDLDAVDTFEEFARFEQSAAHAVRQVNLRDVAVHDHLRSVA